MSITIVSRERVAVNVSHAAAATGHAAAIVARAASAAIAETEAIVEIARRTSDRGPAEVPAGAQAAARADAADGHLGVVAAAIVHPVDKKSHARFSRGFVDSGCGIVRASRLPA